MSRHTASAARLSDNTFDAEWETGSPPVVQDLALLLLDLLGEHPDVRALVVTVETVP